MRLIKQLFIIIFPVFSFVSCSEKMPKNLKGKAVHDKALELFIDNQGNQDSLNFALTLMDSAIKMEPHTEAYYFNKISILEYLKRMDDAFKVTTEMLDKFGSNFKISMQKSNLFNSIDNYDSVRFYALQTLQLLEQDSMMKSHPMEKDFFKFDVYKLLQDSIKFYDHLQYFRNEYRNNSEAMKLAEGAYPRRK